MICLQESNLKYAFLFSRTCKFIYGVLFYVYEKTCNLRVVIKVQQESFFCEATDRSRSITNNISIKSVRQAGDIVQ